MSVDEDDVLLPIGAGQCQPSVETEEFLVCGLVGLLKVLLR